jgi:hypothetical protein
MVLRLLALALLAALAAADVTSAVAAAQRDGAPENPSSRSYENTAPSFKTPGTASMAGETLLDFDTTGATNTPSLPITVPPLRPGDSVIIEVDWDAVTRASAGTDSSIDLCVTGATGSTVITDYDNDLVRCTGPNAIGADPMQYLVVANPADAAANTPRQTLNIMIGLAANAAGSIVPGRISVAVEDHGLGSTIGSPTPASPDAAAAAQLPAPTLTLGASTIHADTTTTLTWSSAGGTSCTATGNANADQSGWSGVQAPSGTFTITPETQGTYVYSLTCSNATSTSPTSSVTLTVTGPVVIGSGGGGLDPYSLLGLAAWVLLRRRLVRGVAD